MTFRKTSLFGSLFSNKVSHLETILEKEHVNIHSITSKGNVKKHETLKTKESEVVGILHPKMPKEYYDKINEPDVALDSSLVLSLFKDISAILQDSETETGKAFSMILESGDKVAEELSAAMKNPTSNSWLLFSTMFLSLLDIETIRTLLNNKASLSKITRIQDRYKGAALEPINFDSAQAAHILANYDYLTTKNSKKLFKEYVKTGLKKSETLEQITSQIQTTKHSLSNKYLDNVALSTYYHFISSFGSPSILPFYELKWGNIRNITTQKGKIGGTLLSPSAFALSKDLEDLLSRKSALTLNLFGRNARSKIEFEALRLKRLNSTNKIKTAKESGETLELKKISPSLEVLYSNIFTALDNFIKGTLDTNTLKSIIDSAVLQIESKKEEIVDQALKNAGTDGPEKITSFIADYILPFKDVSEEEWSSLKEFTKEISGSEEVDITDEEGKVLKTKQVNSLTTKNVSSIFDKYKELISIFSKDKNVKKAELLQHIISNSDLGKFITQMEGLLDVINPKVFTTTIDQEKLFHIKKIVGDASEELREDITSLSSKVKPKDVMDRSRNRKSICKRIEALLKIHPLVIDGKSVEISHDDVQNSLVSLIGLFKNEANLQDIRSTRNEAQRKLRAAQKIEEVAKDLFLGIRSAYKSAPEHLKSAVLSKQEFTPEMKEELKEVLLPVVSEHIGNLLSNSIEYTASDLSADMIEDRFINIIASLCEKGQIANKTQLEIVPNALANDNITQEAIRFINLAACIRNYTLLGDKLEKIQVSPGSKLDAGFVGELFIGTGLPDQLKGDPILAMCIQYLILKKIQGSAIKAVDKLKSGGGILGGWAQTEPLLSQAANELVSKISSGVHSLDIGIAKLQKRIEGILKVNPRIELPVTLSKDRIVFDYSTKPRLDEFINMVGLKVLFSLASYLKDLDIDISSRELLVKLADMNTGPIDEQFLAAAIFLSDTINYQVALNAIEIPRDEEIEKIIASAREEDEKLSGESSNYYASTSSAASYIQSLYYEEVKKLKEQYAYLIKGVNVLNKEMVEGNLENPFIIAFNSQFLDLANSLKFGEELKNYSLLIKDMQASGNWIDADFKKLLDAHGLIFEGVYATKTISSKKAQETETVKDFISATTKEDTSNSLYDFVKVYTTDTGIKVRPVIHSKEKLDKIRGYRETLLGRNKKHHEMAQSLVSYSTILNNAIVAIGASTDPVYRTLASNFRALTTVFDTISKGEQVSKQMDAQKIILDSLNTIKPIDKESIDNILLPSQPKEVKLPGEKEIKSLKSYGLSLEDIFMSLPEELNSLPVAKRGKKEESEEQSVEDIISSLKSSISKPWIKGGSDDLYTSLAIAVEKFPDVLSKFSSIVLSIPGIKTQKETETKANLVSFAQDMRQFLSNPTAQEEIKSSGIESINKVLYQLKKLEKDNLVQIAPTLMKESVEFALLSLLNENVHETIIKEFKVKLAMALRRAGYSSTDGVTLLFKGVQEPIKNIIEKYKEVYEKEEPEEASTRVPESNTAVKAALKLQVDLIFTTGINKRIAVAMNNFEQLASIMGFYTSE